LLRSRTPAPSARRRADPSSPRGHHASAITHLQRTAGNRVVRQILVQRKPVRQGEGLATSTSRDRYVAHAVKLWTTNKQMDLTAFAQDLMRVIGAELGQYGIPVATMTPDSSIGGLGEFNSKQWVIKINIAKFGKATAKTLNDLTAAQVEEAVGTIYHEARHADQNVLVLRSLLAKKMSVDEIVKATSIPKHVVESVRTTKFADKLDASRLKRAARMFTDMYGEHNQLLTFLVNHSPAVAGIEALAKSGSSLPAAGPHVKVFADWHTKVLVPKIATLGSKKKRTAVEDGILTDLRKIDVAANEFFTEWNVTSVAKAPLPDDVEFLREKAAALESSVGTAYHNLESEKDAFTVEAPVKSAFGAKAGTVKKTP
jgi:hypothetical protein